MRLFLVSLSTLMASVIAAHADSSQAIPLNIPAGAQEFVTRAHDQTGIVEVQAGDGSWQVVRGSVPSAAEAPIQPVADLSGPGCCAGGGVPYYNNRGYEYNDGYEVQGGYEYTPPAVVAPAPLSPPVYYYPDQPRIYWGHRYYRPDGYFHRGDYAYHRWHRW